MARPDGPDDAREAPAATIYWYSQTGQLRETAAALAAPLDKAGWRVDWVEVKPNCAFPFPWPVRRFFGIFPEAVDPAGLADIGEIAAGLPPHPGDLVFFAFQVWYLAPSLPMRTMLRTAPQAFTGRDVIGVVACRNMWYSAAVEVEQSIVEAGATYLGTVAATDTAPALATFVTTLRWLLTGRREAFWRFPRAGVGDDELARLRVLGEELAAAYSIAREDFIPVVREILARNQAAPVAPALAAADLIAGRAFRSWGRLIRSASRRSRAERSILLGAFVAGLVTAIVAGLPTLAAVRAVIPGRFDEAVRRRLAPVLATADAKGPGLS
jgi:hypothetical protein